MAPRTRSSASIPPRKGKQRQLLVRNGTEESDIETDSLDNVEGYISRVLNSFRKLKEEVSTLRKKTAELTDALAKAREVADAEAQPRRGRRAGPSVTALQSEVTLLKAKISELEKVQKRDKKKILKLQMREAKRDADELQEDQDVATIEDDTAYNLRKLLRKFSDLMLTTSIEGTEECPICMEKLEVGKTVSFPCQHILCDDCFKQLSPNADEVKCAECRKVHRRDEVETIHYTALSQWDALLKISQTFAAIDIRRTQDTSEEEAEENFINDEESEIVTQTSERRSPNPPASSEEADASSPHTSPNREQQGAGGSVSSHTPRRRRVIATPSDISPELGPQRLEGDVPGPSVSPNDTVSDTNPGSQSTPETSSLPFVESPRAEKKRRLQALAEMRERKRQRR